MANTAAEVISLFGGLLVSVPALATLVSESRTHARVPIWSWLLWSFGLFLFGVYFNRHPTLSGRHHHVITDVVGFPEFFKFLAYIDAALYWAAGIQSKILANRNNAQSDTSSKVRLLFKWIAGPIVLVVHVLVLTKMTGTYYGWQKTKFLRTMGVMANFGSVVFGTGYVTLVHSGARVDKDMWIFQTLGLFVWLLNTTLMYKNVDWFAVAALLVMVLANASFLFSLVFTKKSHSYEQLRDDMVVMDDLPTSNSRPRSHVQQEEF